MSDKRYRQRGYQDDDRGGSGGESRPQPTPLEGPRGRGLGAPTRSVLKCSRCGAAIDGVPVEDASCQSCGSDLHTCANCRYFDSSASKECRQPIEVRIAAKAKRNDCGFFEPKLLQEFASDSSSSGTRRDAKAAFDDLFDF